MSVSKWEELQRLGTSVRREPPVEDTLEDEIVDDPASPWSFVRGGRSVPGIDFEWADGVTEGVEYACLVRRHYAPGQITLRFARDIIEEVTIRGRALDELWDLIRDRKCFRVRITPEERDFRQNGDIKRIVTFVGIKEKNEEELPAKD
jgi:hypothetical protein